MPLNLAEPLVSILINNYNYGQFLEAAIVSALNQTYSQIEVIVVDDGSTDRSREIIANYSQPSAEGLRPRIIPVLKTNGGQASAFNAGFTVSQGSIIIFLDSDDMLLPHIVQRVVETFRAYPDITKVQYQLQVIDADGKPDEKLIPESRYLKSGDLRQHLLRFHSYSCPPTSGNAFATSILQQILPMPEAEYRIVADEYVNNLVPVFGAIASLREVGAYYRVHGNNHFCQPMQSMEDPGRLLRNLQINIETRDRQRKLFNSLYATQVREMGFWEVAFLKTRMTLLKLDPDHHPLPSDRLWKLSIQGCIAVLINPQMRLRGRGLFIFWFLGMCLIPRSIAKSFTENLLYPEVRTRLKQNMLTQVQSLWRFAISSKE